MGFETRQRSPLGSPGPFLAEVTNHLDPTYMGALEVALVKGMPSITKKQGETYVVKYLSPFSGVTSVRYEGNNPKDFNDVQKSYGMWMIPPDIGTTVMVIFIDGDPNQGYWMGCVSDAFQNHMIPGIAATKLVDMTAAQRRKYGTDLLPVAEYHKKSKQMENPVPDRFLKPVHPFADRLMEQGLLLDEVRGVTSSSARREVPSGVFGISTPGPLDDSGGAKRGKIGYEDGAMAPVSRLGGATFVMDDGDVNGQNELVRIRTRTGHQILMHNSHDLIYIGNSKGTAWIELTSQGKIDIFSHDSISIHTEHDFNFRADRDINIEAGRNFNLKVGKNVETNITGYNYLIVDGDQKICIRGSHDEVIGDASKITVGNDYNLSSAGSIKSNANGTINFGAEGNINIGTAAQLNLGANGNILASGAKIHLNGPSAGPPTSADEATIPPRLAEFTLPNRDPNEGWPDGVFYKAKKDIKSIMQRVPTHEPWDQHENINPQQFSPEATDVTLGTPPGSDRASAGVPPNTSATPDNIGGDLGANPTMFSNNTPGADIPPTSVILPAGQINGEYAKKVAAGTAAASGTSVGKQAPANPRSVTPGTCTPEYAKDINDSLSQDGIAAIKAACTKYGLTSPYAIASLLAIVGGESRWQLLTGNYNYSAGRLLEVFPNVFKGDTALAQKYAGNPKNSLPEFLYGSTTSKGEALGNTQPGDGLTYIERGYIQLLGRGNYSRYGTMIGKDLINNPDLLNTSDIAAEVAVKYMLDRCKASQDDPGYIESAINSVGANVADIYTRKKGYYECFLGQLKGSTLSSGSTGSGIVTDKNGRPIKTGSGS